MQWCFYWNGPQIPSNNTSMLWYHSNICVKSLLPVFYLLSYISSCLSTHVQAEILSGLNPNKIWIWQIKTPLHWPKTCLSDLPGHPGPLWIHLFQQFSKWQTLCWKSPFIMWPRAVMEGHLYIYDILKSWNCLPLRVNLIFGSRKKIIWRKVQWGWGMLQNFHIHILYKVLNSRGDMRWWFSWSRNQSRLKTSQCNRIDWLMPLIVKDNQHDFNSAFDLACLPWPWGVRTFPLRWLLF